MLALLAGGCRKPAVPARDWKGTTNCLYFMAFKALGREVPDFPEPGLEPGKSTVPQVAEFLRKFPTKPREVAEGDTGDNGFRYLEASVDDQLRNVYYFANQGGFAGKLTYNSCLVFIPGEDDTLLPAVEAVFGKSQSSEKLVVTNDEGHEESDVDVEVWQTPLGVVTERSTYNEEDDVTVGVVELWVTPAYGQARPRL